MTVLSCSAFCQSVYYGCNAVVGNFALSVVTSFLAWPISPKRKRRWQLQFKQQNLEKRKSTVTIRLIKSIIDYNGYFSPLCQVSSISILSRLNVLVVSYYTIISFMCIYLKKDFMLKHIVSFFYCLGFSHQNQVNFKTSA